MKNVMFAILGFSCIASLSSICLLLLRIKQQCDYISIAILKCGYSFPVVGNVCDHIPSNLPIMQGPVGETPVSILRGSGCCVRFTCICILDVDYYLFCFTI